jgi:hypothetical protein
MLVGFDFLTEFDERLGGEWEREPLEGEGLVIRIPRAISRETVCNR